LKFHLKIVNKESYDLVSNSFWSFISKVTIVISGIFVNYIISKYYGASVLGILSIIISFLNVFSLFSLLGFNISVLKIIPEHNIMFSYTSTKLIVNKIFRIVLFSSIILMLIGTVFSKYLSIYIFEDNDQFLFIVFVSFLIIPNSFLEFSHSIFRALKKVKQLTYLQAIIATLKIIILVLFALLISYDFTPILIVLIFILISATIYLSKYYKIINSEISADNRTKIKKMSKRELIKFSSPMLFTASAAITISYFDFLILGLFVKNEDIGFYSVSNKLAISLSFILKSINSIAAPLFTEYFIGKKDNSGLKKTLKFTSKYSFLLSIPFAIIFILFGNRILNLFGCGFETAYTTLVLLTIAQTFSSFSGSVGYFLSMTGYEKEYRNIIVSSSIFNIIFNFVLIPSYGINGAAISTAFCIVYNNVLSAILIKKRFGFWSYFIAK
jgi:O-antigen/teichoic acid export membrane protein